jgi:PAS domain S-box-containing protein
VELTSQKAQLGELFEQAPEGIVLLDVEDRVLRINPEFTRIFGCAPDEAVGRSIIVDDSVSSSRAKPRR